MSRLHGDPGSDAWTLSGCIDVLAEAARQAGRPGTVWVAGIAYQLVVLGWFSGAVVAGPVLRESFVEAGEAFSTVGPVRWRWLPGLEQMVLALREEPGSALVLVPLALVLFRAAAGLASLSPPERWREARRGRRGPGLWRAWRGGKGLTRSGLGLWVQFLLMMFGATLLFIGPAQLFVRFVHLDEIGALTAVLSGVLIGLLLVYSFLLSILFQIALHSLVANRRGVGSALLHAWRIARNDPMGAGRAAVGDAVLTATVSAIQIGLTILTAKLGLPEALLWVPLVGLLGFGGVARCAFWARVYRILGGIRTFEQEVSGEPPAEPEATAR